MSLALKEQHELGRQKVAKIVSILKNNPNHLEAGQELDIFPVTHTFADGIYTREIFLPKDSVVVGKLHKTEHFNFLLSGKVRVTHDHCPESVILNAPIYFVSKAGMQKVVFAIEDSRWLTVHRTDSETPEEVEEEVIAESYDLLPESVKQEILL
jgi:hypothetical protein